VTDGPVLSLRTWLVLHTMARTGCGMFTAQEAVASTAIEHPEWDLDKRMTIPEWDEWCHTV
jgi:hypothetical protein